MNLTKYEQETLVLFNEAESVADIEVYNGKLKRRMTQLHREHPDDVKLIREDDGLAVYQFPRSWVKINAPRKVKPLTEEQKQRRADTLRATRMK